MAKGKKSRAKKAKEFNISQTRTMFASKFYLEQFAELSGYYRKQGYTRDTDLSTLDKDELKRITKQAEGRLFNKVKKESEDFVVILIKHDKDEVTDGVWEVATAKPHYHLLFKVKDYKKRTKASTVLNRLGIKFDKDRDEELVKGHGLEVPEYFENYAKYLIHNTVQARKDNKYEYSVDDLVMNISVDEYHDLTAVSQSKLKLSKREVDEYVRDLIPYIQSAGESFKDWEILYDDLPLDVKRNSRDVKILQDKYNLGLRKGIESHGPLPKVNIYVKGTANSGKSYASLEVLRKLGRTHEINGGKTGKFDTMTSDKKCLIVDDNTVSDVLNLFDYKPAMTYRRGSGNAVCMTTTNIVTSNLDFNEWLLDCGVDAEAGYDANGKKIFKTVWNQAKQGFDRVPNKAHLDAMLSRFSEVHVRLTRLGKDKFYHEFFVVRYATRGSKAHVEEVKAQVDAIVADMNEISKGRVVDSSGCPL